MPLTIAVANGPIEYLSPTGQQLFIPVSAFAYDETNQLVLVQPGTDYDVALPYLRELSRRGVIRRGVAPAPRPAMVITAVDSGLRGNDIEVNVSAAGSNLQFQVIAKTKHTGLTAADLLLALGTPKRIGSNPGLVRFRDQELNAGELAEPAAKDDITFSAGGAEDPSHSGWISKKDLSGNAFRLYARRLGAGGDKITAIISYDADEVLTLEATWCHTKTLNPGTITLADFEEFEYVIKVSAPASGPLSAPQIGTFKLSGGADATNAVASPLTLS